MAVPLVSCGDRLERLDAIATVLPDADEDAGGERDRELPRSVQGGEAALRGLVGGPAMGCEVRSQ